MVNTNVLYSNFIDILTLLDLTRYLYLSNNLKYILNTRNTKNGPVNKNHDPIDDHFIRLYVFFPNVER